MTRSLLSDESAAHRPAVVLVRVGAAALVLAGAAFAAYPLLRPWTDDPGDDAASAAAFAEPAWVAAHLLGAAGFALLPLGVLALWLRRAGGPGGAAAAAGLVAAVLGAGAVLPYYGAEDFALHALGTEALARDEPALAGLADAVRSGPGLVVFGAGLALVALAGVLLAAAAAAGPGRAARWAGVPLGAGLVLYLPQFFAAPGVREAHGLLVGLGCVLLALAVARPEAAPGLRPA